MEMARKLGLNMHGVEVRGPDGWNAISLEEERHETYEHEAEQARTQALNTPSRSDR